MWLPKLKYDDYCIKAPEVRYRGFIDKNLPLHRAPVIESLVLRFRRSGLLQPENLKLWVGTAVSRYLRELSIGYNCYRDEPDVSLPSSLYTCDSLITLKLKGPKIIVDVPRIVCLPSLKTLKLRDVTYLNEDSLRLLLSGRPVLEDLCINRDGLGNTRPDNLRAIVVNVPTLQRFTLQMHSDYPSGQHVIVTPSLRYFKVEDVGCCFSYLSDHMPKLEEADVNVARGIENLLQSITSVKRLSLRPLFPSAEEYVYPVGIVFNQLEHLKLCIYTKDWSKLLVWLLGISPKLRVLNLDGYRQFDEYHSVKWKDKRSSVPECLRKSLKTFEFVGCVGTQEEKDFLSFFFKHASCLKSTSIIDRVIESDF